MSGLRSFLLHRFYIDLARDLMDLVVDGPESESVWAMYQGGDEEMEEGSALDVDEEMS